MIKHFPAFHVTQLDWVNVHDGRTAKLTELNDLLRKTFAENEVLVEVARREGDLAALSEAPAYIGQCMGYGHNQISTSDFSVFMVVAQNCVASAWHMTDKTSVQNGRTTDSANPAGLAA
jgi:hypothetical protein